MSETVAWIFAICGGSIVVFYLVAALISRSVRPETRETIIGISVWGIALCIIFSIIFLVADHLLSS